MRFFSAVVSVLAVLGLTSCSSTHVSAAIGGARPRVLRFCYSTTSEDPGTAMHRLEPFARYLEKTLHVRVEPTETAGYGGVLEAFRADKIDVASISPFSYILATQKMPIEAIVMRGDPNGSAGDYTGVLAVPGNSPIHTVEDLVKHSHELTVSFVDPASASGFLVENAFLQSQGLDPQRDFRKVVFSMNHIASLMTLKAGKVDVAACMQRLVDRYLQTGKLAAGDVRVIWVSPPIPINRSR